MKVLGITESGSYICEVSHAELEKVLDKYYRRLEKLKPGQTVDIGAGHDFRNEIQGAAQSVLDAVTKFNSAKGTMTQFALMIARQADNPARGEA